MFTRIQFSVAFFALLIGFSACSPNANNPTGANPAASPSAAIDKAAPSTSVRFIKARADEAQISAGESGEAIVHVTVQSGYHINANPPTESYLRATELTAQPADGLSVAFVTYPDAIKKKFSFSTKALAVYEGEVLIKMRLKATAAATKGARSIPAKLAVQACDDEVCYPPGSLELSIPVSIK